VIADERSLNRRRLEHLFEAWGLALPTAAIECRSSGIAKEILMRSDCICLLARLTAHRELQSGSLETIEIDGANLDRPVCLLWPDGQALSSGARALIDAILVVCRERGFMSPPRISVESGRPVRSTLP
jgi:DNA-binding transcriptional LysR family regulator